MRKAAFAMSAIAAITLVAAAPAASAAQNTPAPLTDMSTAWKGKLPVKQQYSKKFNLTNKELRQIQESKRWADNSKARSVRQCESGDTYGINTGNGYYGAWQFAAGTWRGSGGGRYTSYAHQAPKFAQDHIAWKLWKNQGWGPWGCA